MLMDNESRNQLQGILNDRMNDGVTLLCFTQRQSQILLPKVPLCEGCSLTEELLKEFAALHARLTLQVVDFHADSDQVARYGVDKIPCIIVADAQAVDRGIRFYGTPVGYEFASLVESVLDVSTGSTKLSDRIVKKLARVKKPIHVQVFVTPTCPYCPQVVRAAHQMALVNGHIRADMVEIQEFPHLAQKYGIMGVPKVVINESGGVQGMVQDAVLMRHILQAAGELGSGEE
ncbi:thioredoxin family protein [bacterium]|nr:thioredoxin family protein [candidate division CSSED10-310 bacterium]